MLNQKQKEAVEYLEGPLLVLAGPGTGKTQLLSEKVAYILKNTDTNPDNILCLTFTETGASNMRERLKSIVGNEGLKVNINTYHAFGSEILAQYKNYSTSYERKLDAAIDEVSQYKIIKKIQSELSGKDILRGDSVKDIISVISAAKSKGLSAKNLGEIADCNIEDSRVISRAISPLLMHVVPRNFKISYTNAYQPIYEILQEYSEKSIIVDFEDSQEEGPTIERLISILAKDLRAAIVEAESTKKIKPLSKWKDKYFEKDSRGNYRLNDQVANKKLASLANVMDIYDQYLAKNGLYDFDDMIQEAVRVLKTDVGFKSSLEERYQFIMLDEFQDTNPSQFAIIKELTDYEKPQIMAVGDDDQAIYEFQGALSTNLTDFQRHYNANVIPLIENYRSTQEILDFSREIINQAPDRFADKSLIAHQPAPKYSQIFRHEFISSDMEYSFVADEVAKLIKSGVSSNEIAIISYKTKYFMPLLPYLKRHQEIKISYDKKDNLLEDEKIHQIIAISKFVNDLSNNKRSSVSLLEILSFPFFELSMIEAIKLSGKARNEKRSLFEMLADSDNEKIRCVANFLADLVARAYSEPLEMIFDYIIGTVELNGYRSNFLKYYTKKDDYDTFLLYENLAALRGKLNKHFGDKKLKLRDFVEMIDDYEDAEMVLSSTSPFKEADESVKLLSAHKAKGLEFKYVFIISADHTAWGKGKGNNNMLVLPKNLTYIRHTGTTDGEKLRILYVALTRAKSSLCITNSLHDFNEKSPTRLEYLKEFQAGEEVISPLIPAKKVKLHYEESAYIRSASSLKNWLTPYVNLSPDMQAIYKERIKNYRMSASSLTSFVDIAFSGPQEFFKNYLLRAPSEPETEAMAYGDLIHKTFEAVTTKNLSDKEAVEFYLSELEKKDLTSDIAKKIREKGPSDLLVSLKEFSKILLRGKAEVDLSSEKLVINGVPVTGKIDHLIIDENEKTIIIYDFKTGGYHKEKWRSHATLYKYMLQLGFYKLLLNHSREYSKYQVKEAHILFVTPDKYANEVYDKLYEFSQDDENELLTLMKAVYSQIESLNFITDPEIFLSPDKTRGVKDIKEFVSKIISKSQLA